MKPFGILLALLFATPALAAQPAPVHKLNEADLNARLNSDAESAQIQRDGLRDVIRYMDSRRDLFPEKTPKEKRLLRRDEKEDVWNTWQRFLDYIAALDSTETYHADFLRLKGAAREDSFLIHAAAKLAAYRAALEFIDRAEHNRELDKVLNDAIPELGLPAGTYAKLKFKFLNVRMATEFAAAEVLFKTFDENRQPLLRDAIRADAAYLWKTGRGRGQTLTARNAVKVVQNRAGAAWLPIQTGVSEWMGDTKVRRVGRSLVSEKQIRNLQPKLLPGDVILTRREWYLSNVGLPGFWPHAALYIGTPEERRAFFADAEVQAWLAKNGEASGDFESLLQSKARDAYQLSLAPQPHDERIRVIEAISEGVSLTTLEHALECDSLAVLRPKLSKAEKAEALLRAFRYVGRPYDFNFDFSTDAELVCTEVIYKSYEPSANRTGLKLSTVEMLGRKVTPANEIVKQFDSQSGAGGEQFELISFLDGYERHGRAVEASLADFRASWKRPKWHILVQRNPDTASKK